MERSQLATGLLAAGIAGVLVTQVIATWVGPNSAARLEARVEAAANARLTALGLVAWRARADGLGVHLEGVAASDEARDKVVAAIKAASGVTAVNTSRVDVVPLAIPFSWTARKENGRVVLEGVAPSRTTLAAIHNAGRKLYGSDMSSMMTLASGAPAGVEWDVAAIAGLEALVKLQRGTAQLSGDRLTVVGLAASDTDAEIIRNTVLHADTGVKTVAEVEGPPEWVATVERGRITLQGKAASKEAQRALMRAAGGASRSEDMSYVAETGAWQRRAVAALPHLARFERGAISVQGNRFRISGEAAGSVLGYLKEDMAEIRDGFAVHYQVTEAEPQLPEIASIGLAIAGTAKANACQEAFNRVVDTNRIQFASKRAQITRNSGSALDKVAAVARACADFRLEIQGHTDSNGRRDANLALSSERAAAVKDYLVERGLSAGRLTAVGFGSDRPAVSNRTATGRARNRRIEFRVVRGE